MIKCQSEKLETVQKGHEKNTKRPPKGQVKIMLHKLNLLKSNLLNLQRLVKAKSKSILYFSHKKIIQQIKNTIETCRDTITKPKVCTKVKNGQVIWLYFS